jgi:hypothetical protein
MISKNPNIKTPLERIIANRKYKARGISILKAVQAKVKIKTSTS